MSAGQQPAGYAIFTRFCERNLTQEERFGLLKLSGRDVFLSHGYKIAVVTSSQFAHEMGRAREVRLLGTSRLWPDRAPWGEYYMSRNMTYVAWWLYPNIRTKRFVVRHLFRHAGGVLLFGSDKWVCLRRMVEGFWDGRRATLGIRFYPS